MEETLFRTEQKTSRVEAAEKIGQLAEKVRSGDVQLSAGSDSVDLEVPEKVELEVKVEKEGEETSLEIEVEWVENEPGNLEIG